jgi:CubicO group peptidase (beta-lactamase class C family)
MNMIEPGWERLDEAFRTALELGGPGGGALAVYQDGAPVLDVWGGEDPLTGLPWRVDSVTIGFSAAKGVATACLLRLVDSGAVGLDAPIADWWPEFAAAGKDTITVRDALTHRSGLPWIDLSDIKDVARWDRAVGALAHQSAAYPARRHLVYHALTFGFLVGELVRRVDGRPIGAYLAEEVAGPLGLDLWLGQPAEVEPRYRAGLMGPVTDPAEPDPGLTTDPQVTGAAYRSIAQLTDLFRRRDGVVGSEPFNSPEFRAASLPAGGLVTDARSLARLYAACMQPVDGIRLLSGPLLAEAAGNQAIGAFLPATAPGQVEQPAVWGLGFEVSHEPNPMLGPGSFGHSGMGGRLAFGHVPTATAFAFVSQQMAFPPPGTVDKRWQVLLDALRQCVDSR